MYGGFIIGGYQMAKGYRHLSYEERCQIHALKERGVQYAP